MFAGRYLWRPATGWPCLTWLQSIGAGSIVSKRAAFGVALRAALDVDVAHPVTGVDHVVSTAPVEAVFAGLPEQEVRAGVADQDVVVERSLDVLVAARQAHAVAVGNRVVPGRPPAERDVQGPGVGLRLGEGGVVAAGAADQGAARATASGSEQISALAAVEVGRPGQPADQAVRTGPAVDVVAAGAGLDQVVLGASVDHVVPGAAGEADEADRGQRALIWMWSLPGPPSAISQRAGPPIGNRPGPAFPPGWCNRCRRRSPSRL